MKFFKRHKIVLLIALILILLVCGAMFVKEFFFSSDTEAIYGSRLNGIKKVPISDEVKEKIKEDLKEDTSSVKVRLSGRIIYIIIKVKEDTSLEDAKNIGSKTLEYFKEEELKYYDIQIMISSEKESNQFPIIGYKHHDEEEKKHSIVWTKDRAES